jgi:hypothetical protein
LQAMSATTTRLRYINGNRRPLTYYYYYEQLLLWTITVNS